MKWLLALLLLVAPLSVKAISNEACEAYALMREARAEGILVQRSVLDVIRNRMRITGKSACAVLRKPQQFPYFKDGVKKVDTRWMVRYTIVSNMQSVLPKSYMFFNDKPHKWGRNTRRIGNMYFQTT